MDGDSYRAQPDAWRTGQADPDPNHDTDTTDQPMRKANGDVFNAQAVLSALTRPDPAAPMSADTANKKEETPDLDTVLRATFASFGEMSDEDDDAEDGDTLTGKADRTEDEDDTADETDTALFAEPLFDDETEGFKADAPHAPDMHDDAPPTALLHSADPAGEVPLFDDAPFEQDEPEAFGASEAIEADGHPEDRHADLSDEPDEDTGSFFVAPSATASGIADETQFRSIDDPDVPGRKPRIALMGEFSAGKSTLSNLLIGSNPLPTRVTATQLPPVWISWGDGQAYREDLDGSTHAVDIERLGDIDPSKTRVIRLFCRSDILELCDIIDMPGISDPSMSSDVWERVIGKADGVLWCTHATQAWRQSEAAVWESLDKAIFAKSLLLITRFDKLRTEIDRARVLKRIERETRDLFAARLPISLTQALAAGEDAEQWQQSGAAEFTDRLVALLHDLAKSLGSTTDDRLAHPIDDSGPERASRPRSVRVLRGSADAPVMPRRVTPRRVRPSAEGGSRDAAF